LGSTSGKTGFLANETCPPRPILRVRELYLQEQYQQKLKDANYLMQGLHLVPMQLEGTKGQLMRAPLKARIP